MQLNQWTEIGSATIDPAAGYELLFIDQKNQICTIQISGSELARLPSGSRPLALRLTRPVPVPERVIAVRYWNYQRGRLWPAGSRQPPDPRGPFLQLVFLDGGSGEIRMEYRAPTAGQWQVHQTNR